MKTMSYLVAGVATVALVLAASSAQALPTVSIDEFNEANQFIEINDTAPPIETRTLTDNESTVGAGDGGSLGVGAKASIIGGYRDMSTTLQVSTAAELGTSSLVSVGTGRFAHNQDDDVVSFTTLTWDGENAGGLNANIVGYDNVEIRVHSADAGVEWQLTMTDGSANSFTDTFSTLADISNVVLFRSVAPFCAAIDCSDLFSIVFKANNQAIASLDTSVDYIRLVDAPEPATLSILGAGLIGLGTLARRRRKA